MATECAVCCEYFEKQGTPKCPKLLPCGHTFCVSCLTQLDVDGSIKCPVCRAFHLIPNGGAQNYPTNHHVCLETPVNGNNKIYVLSSPEKSSQTDENGSGKCEKHGKPLITFSYIEVQGAQQKFCESCLGPGSYVVSLSGNEDDTVGRQISVSGAIDSEYDSSRREEIGNDVGIVDSEVVLLPRCLATEQLTFPQNHNQTKGTNYFKTFTKYFVLVTCFPIWFSFLITMSLVAIVMGFIVSLCYRIYVAVPHFGCPDDIMHFVDTFLQAFFDRMASVIGHVFCLNCLDNDNSTITSICRKMSKVVVIVVNILDFFLSPLLYLIIIICALVVAKVAILIWSIVEFVFYVVLCCERYDTTRRL